MTNANYPGPEYPFPLSSGKILWLRFPVGGFTEQDVDRLAAYLKAIRVEKREPTPV